MGVNVTAIWIRGRIDRFFVLPPAPRGFPILKPIAKGEFIALIRGEAARLQRAVATRPPR